MNRNPELSQILASGDGLPRNLLSKVKRKVRIALGVVVALVVANYAPLLNTHVDQDNCVFGPVSNEQYRRYLARADARLTFSFYSDRRSLSLKLNDLFDDLSGTEASIYSRLAIMHATLRAFGAEYRNTNRNDISAGAKDPYVRAITSSPVVSFNYALDVNRMWMFSPWPRYAWIIGSLAGPPDKQRPVISSPKKAGSFRFIVWGPSLLERPIDEPFRAEGVCPPVPSVDLADQFSFQPE
jgi:hypothetical protein